MEKKCFYICLENRQGEEIKGSHTSFAWYNVTYDFAKGIATGLVCGYGRKTVKAGIYKTTIGEKGALISRISY